MGGVSGKALCTSPGEGAKSGSSASKYKLSSNSVNVVASVMFRGVSR